MNRPTLVRKLAFRITALALGLMPLVVIELVLAGLGWGEPNWQDDPFVGFRGIRPLFVLNAARDCYEIPPARQIYFRPQSFPAAKSPGEYRVFCLGGSTVQGQPYSTETAFSTWLELALRAADSQRTWRVVNCGGVSYASYRLIPILQEVLGYQPDLIVVCTGHNEFLEDRTYQHIKQQPALLAAAQEWAAGLRTYCLLRGVYLKWCGPVSQPPAGERPVLETEVDARLDYRGGLRQYHRDERWQRGVIRHFALNLERMVQLARQAGVPLLLVAPVSNLRDCPPFKSEHRAGLSPHELERWEQAWNEAKPAYQSDLRAARACLERAAAIDDQYAGLHYQLGQCDDALGEFEQAKHHYLLARDLDICPLRMLSSMRDVLSQIASRTGTPLLDADALIAERCRGGIADDSWLVDHVHPSIRGHQLIAEAIAGWLSSAGVVRLPPGYEQRREEGYQTHLAALDSLYFEAGRRQLECVRDWARGRATIMRPPRTAGESPPGQGAQQEQHP